MRDSPYFPADLAALQLDLAARAAGRATACPREHQEEKIDEAPDPVHVASLEEA
jgi:hypothetical protein